MKFVDILPKKNSTDEPEHEQEKKLHTTDTNTHKHLSLTKIFWLWHYTVRAISLMNDEEAKHTGIDQKTTFPLKLVAVLICQPQKMVLLSTQKVSVLRLILCGLIYR